jgi:hypothetical protein
MATHYHVVEFINGCLNDYDSGPLDTLRDAATHMKEIVKENPDYERVGPMRYQRGLYTLKIEDCSIVGCNEF